MEAIAKLNIACGHCLTTNRVPNARLSDDPVCGKCGNGLLDGRSIQPDDASFDRFIRQTELPVLVDFWAPWCGPCVSMAPQFEEAARQLKGRVVLAKVDSEGSPQTARRFNIRSIPTLVRLQGSRELARHTGALQASQIALFAI